jgi:hypothetical protein
MKFSTFFMRFANCEKYELDISRLRSRCVRCFPALHPTPRVRGIGPRCACHHCRCHGSAAATCARRCRRVGRCRYARRSHSFLLDAVLLRLCLGGVDAARAACPPRGRWTRGVPAPALTFCCRCARRPCGDDCCIERRLRCMQAPRHGRGVAALGGCVVALPLLALSPCGRPRLFVIPIDTFWYALSLPEDAPLRRHVEDLAFATDSRRAWQSAKGKGYKKRLDDSGCLKRKKRQLEGAAFNEHKYGASVLKNRRASLAMRSRQNS